MCLAINESGVLFVHFVEQIASGETDSQTATKPGLQSEIERMDTLLFAAFNARDFTAADETSRRNPSLSAHSSRAPRYPGSYGFIAYAQSTSGLQGLNTSERATFDFAFSLGDASQTPEPASAALVALGLVIGWCWRASTRRSDVVTQ
jgi:hypothetical protein